MKLLVLTFALAASAGSNAATTPEAPAAPLQLRPKAALATTMAHGYAPFVAPASEPGLDLAPRRDARHDQSRSSCASDNALCYDPGSGRIVYKPAREYMPDIPGLHRENISVKRDRIVFRYSF